MHFLSRLSTPWSHCKLSPPCRSLAWGQPWLWALACPPSCHPWPLPLPSPWPWPLALAWHPSQALTPLQVPLPSTSSTLLACKSPNNPQQHQKLCKKELTKKRPQRKHVFKPQSSISRLLYCFLYVATSSVYVTAAPVAGSTRLSDMLLQ